VAAPSSPAVDGPPSLLRPAHRRRVRLVRREAVDVAVVEVGLLGRYDATNVVDADVAVITNVGRRPHRFRRRLARRSPRRRPASSSRSAPWCSARPIPSCGRLRGGAAAALVPRRDFDVVRTLAVGGGSSTCAHARVRYDELFLPCTAPTRPTTRPSRSPRSRRSSTGPRPDVVTEAFASARPSPAGSRSVAAQPARSCSTCAHNPDGAEALADTWPTEFTPSGRRTSWSACSAQRDPAEMLAPLDVNCVRPRVICTPPTRLGRAGEPTSPPPSPTSGSTSRSCPIRSARPSRAVSCWPTRRTSSSWPVRSTSSARRARARLEPDGLLQRRR
jgi:dihydrofolate synthase / folylpolyglutamate synthase